MKTIILYALIAILFFGGIATGLTTRSNTNHKIFLQSADINTSVVQIKKSEEIISHRLATYGSYKFEVTTDTNRKQIGIMLNDQWNINLVEKLVLQKGNIGFYETYTLKSLLDVLNNDSTLLSILHVKSPDFSDSELGCIRSEKANEVNYYLNTVHLPDSFRFVWTNIFDQDETCLYALKSSKGAVLSGSDIERFEIQEDPSLKSEYINFKFKKSAVELWSQLTKNNLNHAIAIVMDNRVLLAPIVRSQITNGRCQISRDFTHDQLKFLVAIQNSGELPVTFRLVK